ncbi:MAG: HNH endonuclease [Bacteroidota bacterium]
MERHDIKLCVYCDRNAVTNSEHVFPYGLGGENIFLDCVCSACNSEFSKLERELIQKSIVGLIRSEVGLEGYSKNKIHPSPFKQATIFHHDESSGIVYEVGQSKGFEIYIRPQILRKDNAYYLEGASQQELEKFSKVFIKWLKDNPVVVQLPVPSASPNAIRFIKTGNQYSYETYTVAKVRKEIILKIVGEDDRYFEQITPRIFLDDEDKIFVRAKSLEEAADFLMGLLNLIENKTPLNSYKKDLAATPIIAVSFNFDNKKVERAVVKIAMNLLFHYYPETRGSAMFHSAKQFVLMGDRTDLPCYLGQPIASIDKIENSHSVSFVQYEKKLVMRINLFSGKVIFCLELKGFSIMKPGEHSAVDIDYIKRKQKFLSKHELLTDRAVRIITQQGY